MDYHITKVDGPYGTKLVITPIRTPIMTQPEGIENIFVNVGTDPDIADLVILKAKRKGFLFSSIEEDLLKASQRNGKDMCIRLRFDYTQNTHHTGFAAHTLYLRSGRYTWGAEQCRTVPVFDLERNLNDFANRPQPTTIRLNSAYTAEISADRKTVKVGCSMFDADKVCLVADVLRTK